MHKKQQHPLMKAIHWFFKSFIGQRILIFLAPFLMPPTTFQQKNYIFAHFHVPYLAPTIGIVFLFSAFLVLLESLKHHGFDLTWLIPIENIQTKIKLCLCLLVLVHAASFARFFGPHLVKLMNQAENLTLPSLSFWFSYYGGVAMVFGAFAWIIVLISGLHLSLFGTLLALSIVIGLIVFARLELKRRQFELHETFSHKENKLCIRLELILFILISSAGLGLIAWL